MTSPMTVLEISFSIILFSPRSISSTIFSICSVVIGRFLHAFTIPFLTLERLKSSRNLNPEVIRPIDNPYMAQGGIAVLKGNIAPDTGIVKQSAVVPEMMVHEGPARVFDCEEDAIKAIKGGDIVPGDVVVIRYEGPKGGPGMREMLNPTSAIAGMGLGDSVALITDTILKTMQSGFLRTVLPENFYLKRNISK